MVVDIMTLWVIGDSFSVDSNVISSEPVYWQWHRILTNKLQIKNTTVIAEFGVSNEWILMILTSIFNEAKENDIIIAQTTEPHRYW